MALENRLRGPRVSRLFVPLVIALLALPIGATGLYVSQSSISRNVSWVELSRQLALDVRSLARNGGDAARGLIPDFRQLSADAANFGDEVKILRQGDASSGTRPLPQATSTQIAAVENAWTVLKKSVEAMLGQQAAYERAVANLAIVSDAGPRLSTSYSQLAARMTEQRLAPAQLALLVDAVAHLERMQNLAHRVIGDGRNARNNAQALDGELRAFSSIQQSLIGDAALAPSLRGLQQDVTPLEQAVATIVQDAPGVESVQLSSALLQGQVIELLAAANSLEQRLDDSLKPSRLLPYLSFGALGIALGSLLGFGWFSYAAVVERQKRAEQRETRQQQAILSLLDEITNLANGDLTVDITVTEDFTGAIADSINYTVQTLRELVGTINATSSEIVAATGSTQNIARQMNEASVRQAREIVSTTFAATQTSQSLQDMARRTEMLSVQAQQSVAVAHNGAGTVGRTIQNMAVLREQIQDTAKRIKRLGESSQEIGNITELINDIAEQTNTLALNASIQAAMAGDAGRGFAVVADEVQRLAERAASATRQIENLVKTIQADTNEAIISMERSTANVVAGAQSAETAGQALTQIEASSQELSQLMQDVSLSARSQSGEVTRIAETMQGMREIAVQTSGSAQKTATAVGELNALSDKLRESVAGFKLPGSSES